MRFLREYEECEGNLGGEKVSGEEGDVLRGVEASLRMTQDGEPLGDNEPRHFKYLSIISLVARGITKVVDVLVDDVARWVTLESSRPEWHIQDIEVRQEALNLSEKMENNTMRYAGLLEELLDELVKEEMQRLRVASLAASLSTQVGSLGAIQRAQDDPDSVPHGAMLMDADGEAPRAGADGEVESEDRQRKMRSVQAKLKRQ